MSLPLHQGAIQQGGFFISYVPNNENFLVIQKFMSSNLLALRIWSVEALATVEVYYSHNSTPNIELLRLGV